MRTHALFAAAAALATVLPARADDAPLKFITTSQLESKVTAAPPSGWSFTIVDARTRVEFEESHLAGAINVPAVQVLGMLPKRINDKHRELVFYCNGPKCTKSQKAARAAIDLGYTNILEYNEGLPAWTKAGLAVAGSPLPPFEVPAISPERLAFMLRSGAESPFLLDLRDSPEYLGFHIKGAVNIPLDQIMLRMREIPRDQEIVLVDHSGPQSVIAVRLLHSLMGVERMKRLDGGLMAWQLQKLPVETTSTVAKTL
jgi:rhodanese-related sulfurtransferase